MIIKIEKFGAILVSRQLGREALAAFLSDSKNLPSAEKIEVDFTGLAVLSPSWADEFFTPLHERFGDRLKIRKTDNASVMQTLDLLERTNKIRFNFV